MKKRISMAIAVATAAAMMTGAAVPVMADDVNITIFNSKMEIQSQFEEMAEKFAEDNGFKVSKVVKVPASTYLQLEVPEAYENVQMIITDADGNALQKFGGSSTDPENGMYQIKMQFEQTDTDQIHVQVVDMNQSTNEELKVVAEITASLN